MATREMSREKEIDLKSMHVNLSKSETRLIKEGFGIKTDLVGRQCLDLLST